MDGFAIRVVDATAELLPIAGEVRIGSAPPSLPARSALRIVTGGAIPPGADAVVKREEVEEDGRTLRIGAKVLAFLHAGDHIRHTGENIREKQEVCGSGIEITASVASALASFGMASPLVHRRVRVALIVTGDELVEPNQMPAPWQIRDSNGTALATLLSRRTWLNVHSPRRAADDSAILGGLIRESLASSDVVILTGGVSMGHRDHVAPALREAGLEVIFHRLAQRPGKPLLAAVTSDRRPVFGLPGNPVSVMVTARRFVIPALSRIAGLRMEVPIQQFRHIERPDAKQIDLWWHRLVRQSSPDWVQIVGGMGSGDAVAAARSDGFVEVPPQQTGPGPWPFFAWAW
jgi:molybdopterin molybdotransferase